MSPDAWELQVMLKKIGLAWQKTNKTVEEVVLLLRAPWSAKRSETIA